VARGVSTQFNCAGIARIRAHPLTLALAKRTVPMLFAFFEFLDWIEDKMPWLMTWTFMISMAVLAIVLFIVLRILQNRRPDDD
jgi:uncharacterized BrkB/YihY/UPF0761 family membrane protein